MPRLCLKPSPQLGRDCREWIGPTPQSLRLCLCYAGRAYLALLPCRAQPGEELLQCRRGRFRRVTEDGAVCDRNELLLDRTDLLQQTNWVQRGAQLVHAASYLPVRPWVRQQSLTGCSRGVIALPDLRPITRLRGQLERGLEEIHEQPHRGIQSRQRGRRFQALEAAIADRATHDRAILLFHPSLVVLAIGTAARELDRHLLAIIPNGLVHEHAVVVRVQPEQGKGSSLRNSPSTSVRSRCSRTGSGALSGQPV